MRTGYLGAAALAAALVAGPGQAAPPVTGEYVESRSANVYVGACHREGEVQTTGRNAVLAWNITDGEHQGVALKGVTAVAVLAADRHPDLPDAKRRSVIYVSAAASPDQRVAVVALLKERAAAALGAVVDVKSAPIRFNSSGDLYRVHVEGAALMKIRKQTGELCCKQPYQLWSKPFVPVENAKAGYCVGVEFRDSGLLQTWSATDQNNALFGRFAL